MADESTKERREYSRAKVASFVIIRCELRYTISSKQPHEFHTHTENISEGGINVILEEELRCPDIVEIKLFLTGKLAPLECNGQVVWSKLSSPASVAPPLYTTAIKFIGMGVSSREAIRKVVDCLG